MQLFGLIGEKLTHSYSKLIHERLMEYSYNLISLNSNEFDQFMQKRAFNGINVTIPYKERVLPYLDKIDENAKRIGSVNTIINKDNHLMGYNTDYDGFKYLLDYNNINIHLKKCLILGTGGTSKTVKCVLEDLGAKSVIFASKSKKSNNCYSYEEILKNNDVNIIVNTTPVGMYPNINDSVLELTGFNSLECVIDVIFNPLRTMLLQNAAELNVKYINGLLMLVYQAIVANTIFTGKKHDIETVNKIYNALIKDKCNIVLIGMPGAGKSEIGILLSKQTGRRIIDIDDEIEKEECMCISEIFERFGENYFRDVEKRIITQTAIQTGVIISTGGGVIKNIENIRRLKANGVLFYLDRSIDNIFNIENSNRPLIKSRADLSKLFFQRQSLYEKYCDIRIENNAMISEAVKKILEFI